MIRTAPVNFSKVTVLIAELAYYNDKHLEM
jgi:hypothetical protein